MQSFGSSSFDTKAKEWDKLPRRVQNALSIAEAIQKRISLHKEMEIIDFGVGTGLLGFEIAKEVKKVYGIDTSKKMLEELKAKNTKELSIEPLFVDITKESIDLKVDGIVSSMTLHHIKDLENFFTTIKNNLKEGGFIALADLESEDGSFHTDNTGVHHFGFDKEELKQIIQNSGFKDVTFETIHTINKPHKDFPIFLLTAFKDD